MFPFRLKKLSHYLDKALTPSSARDVENRIQSSEKERKCLDMLEALEPALEPKKALSANFTQDFRASLPDVKRINAPSFAKIASISGFIMIYREGQNEGVEAFPEMDLKKGDSLRVIGDSVALIELNDGSAIYLNRETQMEFMKDAHHVSLKTGEMFSMMKPQKVPFMVSTPSAMLAVLGTDFHARVTDTLSTILSVLKGSVLFQNESGSVIVNRKKQVEAARSAKPVARIITDYESLVNWTSSLKPKRDRKGGIMKKLVYIGLFMTVIIVGILGYNFYQNNIAYEPSSRASDKPAAAPSSQPAAQATPSPVQEQTPSQNTEPVSSMLGEDYFTFNRLLPVSTRVLLQVNMDQNVELILPNNPNPMRSRTKISQDLLSTVLNHRAEGGQEVLVEFSRIQMDLRDPKGNAVYDSLSPEQNTSRHPAVAVMKALKECKLHVFSDAKGKVEKVEGFEEYLNAMKTQMPQQKNQNTDIDSMKDMLAGFSAEIFPDRPVKIGETWPQTTSLVLPGLGSMNIDTQYLFKDWDKKGNYLCALVEFQGTISGQTGSSTNQTPMSMSVKEGTSSGRMWLDKESGTMVEMINDQNMVFESKIRIPLPSGAREQITTMKFRQIVNAKLMEINLGK